jgi:hypothetical protein
MYFDLTRPYWSWGMQRRVDLLVDANVSKKHRPTASIFWVKITSAVFLLNCIYLQSGRGGGGACLLLTVLVRSPECKEHEDLWCVSWMKLMQSIYWHQHLLATLLHTLTQRQQSATRGPDMVRHMILELASAGRVKICCYWERWYSIYIILAWG